MDDDVVFFAMVQRYNIYFKYVSLRHDIWIVMVLSHPRRISTGPYINHNEKAYYLIIVDNLQHISLCQWGGCFETEISGVDRHRAWRPGT